MKLYSVTTEEMSRTANQLADSFMDRLLRDGVITKEAYDAAARYQFVCYEKGFWRRAFGKWLGDSDSPDQLKYTIVRADPHP